MSISKVDQTITFAPFRAAAASSGRLAALRILWVTLRDSFLAYRHYEHLRSKGTPHRAALTKALGAPSETRPHA